MKIIGKNNKEYNYDKKPIQVTGENYTKLMELKEKLLDKTINETLAKILSFYIENKKIM